MLTDLMQTIDGWECLFAALAVVGFFLWNTVRVSFQEALERSRRSE